MQVALSDDDRAALGAGEAFVKVALSRRAELGN